MPTLENIPTTAMTEQGSKTQVKRYAFTPVPEFRPRDPAQTVYDAAPEFQFINFDAKFNEMSLRELAKRGHEEWRSQRRAVLSDLEAEYYFKRASYVLLYTSTDTADHDQLSKRLRYYLMAVRLVAPAESYGSAIFSLYEGDHVAYATLNHTQVYVLPGEAGRSFDETILPAVSITFHQMQQALASVPNRIVSAIRMFNSGQTGFWDIDRIVPYATCLESLFGRETEEITHRLKTRVAWFLEPADVTKRQAVFDCVGKFYRLRSILAHGRLEKFLERTPSELQEHVQLIGQIEHLIRAVFQKIFTSETLWPFFGTERPKEDREFADFLDRLVLGGTNV